MRNDQSAPGSGCAAKDCVPQTRDAMVALLASSEKTDVASFVHGWLMLDDEMAKLESQTAHVKDVLNDRLLGTMLKGQLADLLTTIHRRARELAAMPAVNVNDIYCKCYVRARLRVISPDDQLTVRYLADSIRQDLNDFETDSALTRTCA